MTRRAEDLEAEHGGLVVQLTTNNDNKPPKHRADEIA